MSEKKKVIQGKPLKITGTVFVADGMVMSARPKVKKKKPVRLATVRVQESKEHAKKRRAKKGATNDRERGR
jgi:hypothetical protein